MYLNYRPVVAPAEREQTEALWDCCFEKREEAFFQYYFNNYCFRRNRVLGGFLRRGEEEALAAMAHINPYVLQLRGREQAVPYLVGLAVTPEERGKGLLREMLGALFAALEKEGHAFAVLMPIYAGLYLPSGFAFCYLRHRYEVPAKYLRAWLPKYSFTVEEVPLENAANALAPLYEKYIKHFNGAALRDSFAWQKLLAVHAGEEVKCALARKEGEAQGYILYQKQPGRLEIVEEASLDAEAKHALLLRAAELAEPEDEVSYAAAEDDLTYLYFPQQRLSGKTEPFMMARCLNVKAALQALVPAANLPRTSFTLRIEDAFIAENRLTLRLALAPASLKTEEERGGEADINMDIAAFTQLYFGVFSVDELQRAGRVQIAPGREEGARLLAALLPKQRTWINEYF